MNQDDRIERIEKALAAIAVGLEPLRQIAVALERAYPPDSEPLDIIESSIEGEELTIATNDVTYASVMVSSTAPDVVSRFVDSVIRMTDDANQP